MAGIDAPSPTMSGIRRRSSSGCDPDTGNSSSIISSPTATTATNPTSRNTARPLEEHHLLHTSFEESFRITNGVSPSSGGGSGVGGMMFGRRRPSVGISADGRGLSKKELGAEFSEETHAEAATKAEAAEATVARIKLEEEAPIRGLAKAMSRLDIFSNPGSSHGKTKSSVGHFRMSSSSQQHNSRAPSRPDTGVALERATPSSMPTHPAGLSVSLPPRPQQAGAKREATAAAGVAPGETRIAGSEMETKTAGVELGQGEARGHQRDAQGRQAVRPMSVSPRRLEEGGVTNPAPCVVTECRSPCKPGITRGHSRVRWIGGGAGRRASPTPSPRGDVPYPDTPPPLRSGNHRRENLVRREVHEDEVKGDIKTEYMIGEIQNISIKDEIVLVRKALVVIVLSFLAAVFVSKFATPLEYAEVKIFEVVQFVALLLLSFPVIRFTARLLAYWFTTRASTILYKGNRYYFIVALHNDVAVAMWSVAAVFIWKQLFHRWVLADQPDANLANAVFRYGDQSLECYLALRVGILTKNFLVLLVATGYLWKPYLERVQSSILAQYMLLLLTDYCTKGYCNPDDQRFAIEMGRQGIAKGQKISLYAISKAMGFIPRNKLGHSFFRELAGSDTLDSSQDATTLGNFLFDQLLIRSRPQSANVPSFFGSPPRKGIAAALTGVAGGVTGTGGGVGTRAVRSGGSGGLTYKGLPLFGMAMQKRNGERVVPAVSQQTSPTCAAAPEKLRQSISDVDRHGGGEFGAAVGVATSSGKASDDVSSFKNSSQNHHPVTERASPDLSNEAASGGGLGISAAPPAVFGDLEKDRDRGGDVGASRKDSGGDCGRKGEFGTKSTIIPGTSDICQPSSERGVAGSKGRSFFVAREAQEGNGSFFDTYLLEKNVGANGVRAGVGNREDSGWVGGGGNMENSGGSEPPPSSPPPPPTSGVISDESLGQKIVRGGSTHANIASVDGSTFYSAYGSTVSDMEGGESKDGRGDSGGNGGSAKREDRQEGREKVEPKVMEDGKELKRAEDDPEQEEVLVRKTLCPALEPELLDVAFHMFDLDNSGTVTKEEMVLGVVGTFKDHRSLARTLEDSEHIAQKLGLIIMWVILFILFFVWLSIWGLDVVSLSVTFASFLIAFSFMIGTAASNLMSAVLFIFVSRLYDVGDRVHIYDSSSITSGDKPTDVTVVKVDLMTTVFKRWDEQIFYMPNHLLATKTIVNIQRAAHQWHEFMIHVSAATPAQKLSALQTSLQAFAKSKDRPEGLYPRMGFSLVGIEDSTKLTIRITFRQRGNWQNMEKKWACQSMCTWAIKSACDTLDISYVLPEVPLRMQNKLG